MICLYVTNQQNWISRGYRKKYLIRATKTFVICKNSLFEFGCRWLAEAGRFHLEALWLDEIGDSVTSKAIRYAGIIRYESMSGSLLDAIR
jgi:hypothetical protein